jgi:hypothetical protein
MEEIINLIRDNHRAMMDRIDLLEKRIVKLTAHTVECTTIDDDQPYKCKYHRKYPWDGYLCPDHAKREGQPHEDIHLANLP